jgi:hypothetical protein
VDGWMLSKLKPYKMEETDENKMCNVVFDFLAIINNKKLASAERTQNSRGVS